MKIRTVTGDISPQEAGIIDAHNHAFIEVPDWVRKKDPDLAVDELPVCLEEMRLYKNAGGGTLVDCTAIDYGRDVVALKEISDESKVFIIATSGFKEDIFTRNWLGEKPFIAEQIEEQLFLEITAGVGNTGIRCGVLKASTSYNRVTDLEEQVLRIVARVQKRTSAPTLTHCTSGTMGLEQVEILEREGADLSHVSIGHLDMNPDPWYVKSIARKGAFVSLDTAGKSKYHPDSHRVELLRALLDAGLGNHVLLGMDIGRKSDCRIGAGGLGHDWLLTHYIPRLREEGFAENSINQFLVENPQRWLAF